MLAWAIHHNKYTLVSECHLQVNPCKWIYHSPLVNLPILGEWRLMQPHTGGILAPRVFCPSKTTPGPFTTGTPLWVIFFPMLPPGEPSTPRFFYPSKTVPGPFSIGQITMANLGRMFVRCFSNIKTPSQRGRHFATCQACPWSKQTSLWNEAWWECLLSAHLWICVEASPYPSTPCLG